MKKIIPSLLALSLVAAFSAHAVTPKDTLVIAQSTDDADSFDPAQGFNSPRYSHSQISISAWFSPIRKTRPT